MACLGHNLKVSRERKKKEKIRQKWEKRVITEAIQALTKEKISRNEEREHWKGFYYHGYIITTSCASPCTVATDTQWHTRWNKYKLMKQRNANKWDDRNRLHAYNIHKKDMTENMWNLFSHWDHGTPVYCHRGGENQEIFTFKELESEYWQFLFIFVILFIINFT